MAGHLLLGERLEIWSVAEKGKQQPLVWGSLKTKRGLFGVDQHYLHGKKHEDITLGDLMAIKGSQGEQTDGTEDYDDIVRFSKDYTIRCLTHSKVGGRFLTTSSGAPVFSTTTCDVARDGGFNKAVLFKIRASNETSRGLTAKSMFAEEVYANTKVVFESTAAPGKFISITSKGSGIGLEGLSSRSIFVIKRANLSKYLTNSDDSFGKLNHEGIMWECHKKSGGSWVARSHEEHFVNVHGKPLQTVPTFDGLGMWRVHLNPGADPQGWDYGAEKWSHFLDPKRRPFQYTGKETKRVRRWVHQNSRFFKNDEAIIPGKKKQSKPRRFSTAAGEMPDHLDFLPSQEEAMKQAAANSVLKDDGSGDEESDEEHELEVVVETGAEEDDGEGGEEDSAPRKDSSASATSERSSFSEPQKTPEKKARTKRAAKMGFDEVTLQKRDDTKLKNWWAMDNPIPRSDSWTGHVWLTRKIDGSATCLDGIGEHSLHSSDSVHATVQNEGSSSETVVDVKIGEGKEKQQTDDTPEETKEEGTEEEAEREAAEDQPAEDGHPSSSAAASDKEAPALPRVCYGHFEVSSDRQEAILTVGDQKIVIDLTKGIVVCAVKDAVAAEKSLLEGEAKTWSNRLSILEAKIDALKVKRKGKLKAEQDAINKKIYGYLDRRLAYRDQSRGRLPAQGWLQLKIRRENNKVVEWVISPVETESSYVYGVQEGSGYIQGKRDNYRNNFEICRQVLVDNIPETREMKREFSKCIYNARRSLAGMVEYQAKNCARDATMAARQSSQDELEMEKELGKYQERQEKLLKESEEKVFEVINNNKVVPFVQACDEWLADIAASEDRGKKAAEEGLHILHEQTEVLDGVLETIKIAAEEQALLTLQYAVPLFPGKPRDPPWKGSREWRDKLERGEASGFDEMIGSVQKKAGEATGMPVGMMAGGPPAVPSLSIGNPLSADAKDGEAKPAESVDLEAGKGIAKNDEKQADQVEHEKDIADETTNLLNSFARQPEEWENHRSFCGWILFFMCVNFILLLILSFA